MYLCYVERILVKLKKYKWGLNPVMLIFEEIHPELAAICSHLLQAVSGRHNCSGIISMPLSGVRRLPPFKQPIPNFEGHI